MHTLNLGPQNVATAREAMEPAKEIRMKSLGTCKKRPVLERKFRSFYQTSFGFNQ